MTLHDLIMNGIIKDDEKIKVVKPMTGKLLDVRRGYWFNDRILDFHNHEITEFSWSKENGWTISLDASEIEPVELPFC